LGVWIHLLLELGNTSPQEREVDTSENKVLLRDYLSEEEMDLWQLLMLAFFVDTFDWLPRCEFSSSRL
jgi:hypothetical protein